MTPNHDGREASAESAPMDKLHELLHPTAEAILPRIEEALRRFKNRDCAMRIPVNESDLDIVLRASANVIDEQTQQIARLRGALQQAADLIAIPAACHAADNTGGPVTGTPRYSEGARRNNRECFLLLPVLRAVLAPAGGAT